MIYIFERQWKTMENNFANGKQIFCHQSLVARPPITDPQANFLHLTPYYRPPSNKYFVTRPSTPKKTFCT